MLKKYLSSQNYYLSDEIYNKLDEYKKQLYFWGKRINLISHKELENIEIHLIDSLSLLPNWIVNEDSKILDLGSGGGLPALPLAISRQDLQFILIERNQKKATFLSQIIRQLQLSNVKVFAESIEEIIKEERYQEKFNFVISRAVSSLEQLWKWSFPLLRVDGSLIAYKGIKYKEEIKGLEILLKSYNGNIKTPIIIQLPQNRGKRYLCFINKEKDSLATKEY